MSLASAIILGIIEGLTEFLPVSSTAHLLAASRWLRLGQSDFLELFEVCVQAGAILAILVSFGGLLLRNKKLLPWLIISSLPTAIFGLAFYSQIKKVLFESVVPIALALAGVGLVFILVENAVAKKKIQLKKGLDSLTLSDSLLVGLGQSLALLPGVSRSGIVMVTMMLLGFRRPQAAVFSFLLAVPAILGASGLDLLRYQDGHLLNSSQVVLLFAGSMTAFLTALIVVKWFVGFIRKRQLTGFGIYRILLAILLLILL